MMEKIEVFMKNRSGSSEYNAKAIYYGDRIIVMKKSKINKKIASSEKFKLTSIAQSKRDEKHLMDKDNILVNDVEFKSASAAGQFVCGYSVSGMTSWRDKNGKTLKELLKEE